MSRDSRFRKMVERRLSDLVSGIVRFLLSECSFYRESFSTYSYEI